MKNKGLSYRQKRLIKAVFSFENFIFLFCSVFFLSVYIGFALVEDYPDVNSLVYEDCTFIKYEYIEYRYSKSSKMRYYNIYVEEYDKPLQVDNIVYKRINKDLLLQLNEGDTIKVSLLEEKEKFYLYSLSCGGVYILSYEDYLSEHESNDSIGSIVLPALLCMSFVGFIVGVKKRMSC